MNDISTTILPALKPLFIWAGGKRRLLPKYAPFLPELSTIPAYVEPFLGGAAMFSAVAAAQPHVRAILGDINQEVVAVYDTVKRNPEAFIQTVCAYESHWLTLSHAARKTFYYDLRQQYWAMPASEEATALLYFLMRTGFNGIWQTCVLSKGRYGTPVGLAKQKTPFISPALIRQWSDALLRVDIKAQPYESTTVPSGAFVYCDPPYRGSFTSYGQSFDDTAQLKLVDWCRQTAQSSRALVWLSNRDIGDDFFVTHAADATQVSIPVIYTAGRRKKTDTGYEAKPATELLLVWDGRDL